MKFFIEKISISRNELLKNQDGQLLREIMDEPINNNVESIICEMISKIIKNEKEIEKYDSN